MTGPESKEGFMTKKVLITGSSHGIGAATAIAFAKAGYHVGVNYFKDQKGAEETAQQVESYGVEATVYRADVSENEQCEKMLSAFLERFGTIDVLVNNAGGALKMPEGGFEQMPMSYWDSQVRLNLSAAAYCSQPAVANMIENKTRGKIINISSIHSFITWVKRKTLPYSAAKAGLNMFTKSLAVEVIKHGINVNCIAPGFIMTKIASRYSQDQMNGFLRKIPAGFVGTVDDITPLILFLADDEKARFIVGQTFVVDGGQSIDGVIDMMIE
jgi:NAD(P)-dependent dehydrogenase (short-subunit alcohol dehydrogenase family)